MKIYKCIRGISCCKEKLREFKAAMERVSREICKALSVPEELSKPPVCYWCREELRPIDRKLPTVKHCDGRMGKVRLCRKCWSSIAQDNE